MPLFNTLQPCSFDGIKFAVEAVSVKGGLRDHIHEFPHSPGGLPEILGRKLYTFSIKARFDTNLFRHYPDAWPGDLSDLRDRFEQGVISTLVVPSVGDVQAYCVEWDNTWVSKVMSGESADFTFREAESDLLLTSNVVQTNYQALGALLGQVIIDAQELGISTDLFGSISKFINSINAVADQAELMSDIYSAKVTGLADECRGLIQRADELQQPKAHKVLFGVRSIGVAAIRIHEDLLQKLRNTFLFIAPANMDLFGVARSMYGDTSRLKELLLMNAVNDIDDIRKGTIIRGYLKAA